MMKHELTGSKSDTNSNRETSIMNFDASIYEPTPVNYGSQEHNLNWY